MLEDLIARLETERTPLLSGNTGNTGEDPRVTATSRATPSRNTGNMGNTLREIGQHDDDVLMHPERYEIVEFTEWRLPSGRRVAFKLAIPKERYDGFELLRLLEIQKQDRMTTINDEG